MKLTQEQINRIATEIVNGVANAAYALGIAEGKALGAAEMRDRCVKVCDDSVELVGEAGFIGEDRHDAGVNTCVNLAKAIRALKETT